MRSLAIVLLAAVPAAHAQLGGLGGLGRIKDKIDNQVGRAKQKAKPVQERAEKAVDTFTAWSPEEEQAIGLASAEKMVAMFGLVSDPAIEKYVNLVGQAVAQYAPRQLPWRFGVLDTEIVGAFALPGGYVFLTRGALAGMTSEAQLAGALGHEVQHTAARHLETEVRSKKTSAWAMHEAATSTAQGRAITQGKADALLKDLFNTKLSRSKEEESDDQGAQMAAKAGYAPAGLLEFLGTLSEVNTKPENQRLFGQLLTTHPAFEDRIEHLKASQAASGEGQTLEARFRKVLGR